MLKKLAFPVVALFIWTLVVSAVAPWYLWLPVELLLVAHLAYLIFGSGGRRSRISTAKTKDYPDKAQRKFVVDVRRHWNEYMDQIGLVIETPARRQDQPPVRHLPELVGHGPVPIGVVLKVMPAAGKQSVEDLLALKGKFESAWGYPVRMFQTGPASLDITVEFVAPLETSREVVSESWMEERRAV